MGLHGLVPAGVVTGDNLIKLMTYCRDNSVALPAFNCTSTSTINAILQAARDINSPVIIQVNFEECEIYIWVFMFPSCVVFQRRSGIPRWKGNQEHRGEGGHPGIHSWSSAREAHGQALRSTCHPTQRSLRKGRLVFDLNK